MKKLCRIESEIPSLILMNSTMNVYSFTLSNWLHYFSCSLFFLLLLFPLDCPAIIMALVAKILPFYSANPSYKPSTYLWGDQVGQSQTIRACNTTKMAWHILLWELKFASVFVFVALVVLLMLWLVVMYYIIV